MPISSRKVGVVGNLIIDYPASLNALDAQILNELDERISVFCDDQDIKIVIISGTGKAFIAGADISSMAQMSELEAQQFSMLGSDVFQKIENSSKVFIAAINGYALGGGCELALACDIRIASDKAKFGLPEVSLGVFPGFSGIRRMMEIVGEGYTKELVYTGKMISANEAVSVGLVNKVVPHENLEEECLIWAQDIASNSFNAVIQAKKAIRLFNRDRDDFLMKEHSKMFAECFSHPDQKEGMRAFLEKRKPNFD